VQAEKEGHEEMKGHEELPQRCQSLSVFFMPLRLLHALPFQVVPAPAIRATRPEFQLANWP
jgi:hypothetical protein